MESPPDSKKSMNTKDLLDKFANGEITEEQFDSEKNKLSPEEQKQLNEEAERKLPDAVEKLKGVRRGIEKISKDNLEKDATFANKLRDENLSSAQQEVFKKYGIEKTEDQQAFMEGFKKFDTGNVTVDNIVKDMKAFYASTNADELLSLKEQQKERELEAEEFNANGGGTHGSGGGTESTKKASKEVKAFMDASARAGRPMTIERAERALELAKKGGKLD